MGTALAVGLIGAWIVWWVASVRRDSMVIGRSTWVPPLAFLAGDFKVHIDHVARIQAAGIDPYRKADDWICVLYPYPPMIARAFAWVSLVNISTAVRIWLATLAVLFAAGAFESWRTRRSLRLDDIPLAWMVAAVLFGAPAMFAMERGQSDPMVILPLIVAARLLGRRKAGPDVLAGALLGATAWLKYYPGLTVVALVALGRPKAVAAFVGIAVLIGVVDRDGVRQSIHNGAVGHALMADKVPHVHEIRHSLVENWGSMRFVRAIKPLKLIPGSVAAAALLLPAIVGVSRKVARSADSRPLIFPYLLWLTAAATFGMPYANDYNLVTLPLAALAVWDRRDSWQVHLALGLSVLWLQPFWLPLGGQGMLVLKLATLYAVGASLAARSIEPARSASPESVFRPILHRDRPVLPGLIGGPAPGSRSS